MTPHFTLAELTRSAKAAQMGIDNTPPADVLPRLQLTAEMLERIRSTLGAPVVVTSGYRCRQLNLVVGGVTSSDHAQGNAADIIAPRYGTPYQVAKALAPLVSALGIGQLILESITNIAGVRKSWVHVSTRTPEMAGNRIITITDTGVQLGIQVVA